MPDLRGRTAGLLAGGCALAGLWLVQSPASAQTAQSQGSPAFSSTPDAALAGVPPVATTSASSHSQTDIFSLRTFTVLFDARLIAADGERSFLDGGLGKTRFSGGANGDLKALAKPIEADLIWQPRFTGSLTGNVSAAYQRGQENGFDLIEAFATWIPPRHGSTNVSAKAGLYWPEISQEHATGGAWSTVYTLTPSAINSWVGEEVKFLGTEGTLSQDIGQHQLAATAGIFGLNDTSGTLLSFRGWALHDVKATAFGHFQLPPLNPFIKLLQSPNTRSLAEIDNRLGFYGRLEWRPPWPFTVNAFYYDNQGNPQAFTTRGQWGWRTRFLNLGLSADLGHGTRIIAQGMTGSSQMGFRTNGRGWVHTHFESAFALVSHQIGRVQLSARIEAFGTEESGSEMPPSNSENGGAITGAGRYTFSKRLTGFVEVVHVRSHRGTRADFFGESPFQAQTVAQMALRLRL